MVTIIDGGFGTRHESSFIMSRPNGLPHYVLLIIRCPSIFTIHNINYSVKENSALIIKPNTPYSYHNPDGPYSDDWLHFDLRDSCESLEYFPEINIPFPIGNHSIYTTYIQQILWEQAYNNAPLAKENALCLFNIVIHNLAYAYAQKDHFTYANSYYEKLQHLRLQVQNSITEPHSIKEASKALGLSESYFQFLYKKYFNISFQKDIIQMRVEYAKGLISSTDLTMEQVSELCGYSNHVHFYRQFKKIAGITPAKYRL